MNNHNQTQSSRPALVSVMSGKGGVGKSVLTLNLGERLAAEGYRVLLVDADTACGNLHILANLAGERGLVQFANDQLSLAETVMSVAPLLDLLPSPVQPELNQANSAISITDVIRRLRLTAQMYDLVLVDHPSGVSSEIPAIVKESSVSLLVMVPELTSIADSYGLYKYVTQADKTSNDIHLVINRVESGEEADHIAGKFRAMTERFLGRVPGFLGYLEESKNVRQAVGRQCPLSALDAQLTELQSLRRIGRRLVAELKLGLAIEPNTNKPRINNSSITVDTRG